jgi:hypothetical protein
MMFRVVLAGLLVVGVAQAMIVRRQAEAALASPDCQFPLLPVLKVCPPCQPSSCYCANGKELSSQDQLTAEQVSNIFCSDLIKL